MRLRLHSNLTCLISRQYIQPARLTYFINHMLDLRLPHNGLSETASPTVRGLTEQPMNEV